MSVHYFTIDSDNLFQNRKVDIPRFVQEIQTGLAAVTLTDIEIQEGNCVVTFSQTLSNAQVLTLEAIVFAHTGTPLSLTTTGFTTTSTSYVAVPGLALSPLQGTYRVRFSGAGFPQSNNKTQTMAIFKNGSVVSGSERTIKSGGSQTAGMVIGFSCEVVVTTGVLEKIEARVKSDAQGSQTAELFDCTLTAPGA